MSVVIPKSTKNAERVIRFLEYCASTEGQLDLGYGIQGEKWTGDFANGPHYNFNPEIKSVYFEQGKPVLFKEFAEERTKDFDAAKRKSGIAKHQILSNWALNNWDIWEWNGPNPRKQKFDEEIGKSIKFKEEFNFNIDAASDIGVIKKKVENITKDYEIKIIFSKTDNELMAQYNEMLQKCEQAGLSKVEAEWTRQYKENLKRIGK